VSHHALVRASGKPRCDATKWPDAAPDRPARGFYIPPRRRTGYVRPEIRAKERFDEMRALTRFLTALAAAAFAVTPALAARPEDRAIGFQDPATPIMQEITDFHDWLVILIAAITAFVMLLLLWVMVRYRAKANPIPRQFSHNTLVEVLWTGIPAVILIVIAVPSFRLLYNQGNVPDGVRAFYRGEVIPAAELTIKATGHQWYWSYEYPDNGDINFFSRLLSADVAGPEDYLLAVDAPMVAPAGVTVRLTVTGADVIHNWAMPAFGIKTDAIPGRLNETWFRVEEPGTYFGQCSELCGKDHAYMPIQVEIVPRATFTRWASAMATGDNDGAARIVAEFKSEAAGQTRLAEAR
jgi:cytochrome c oxidase subunit 2